MAIIADLQLLVLDQVLAEVHLILQKIAALRDQRHSKVDLLVQKVAGQRVQKGQVILLHQAIALLLIAAAVAEVLLEVVVEVVALVVEDLQDSF
jgi:hypothetical protein